MQHAIAMPAASAREECSVPGPHCWMVNLVADPPRRRRARRRPPPARTSLAQPRARGRAGGGSSAAGASCGTRMARAAAHPFCCCCWIAAAAGAALLRRSSCPQRSPCACAACESPRAPHTPGVHGVNGVRAGGAVVEQVQHGHEHVDAARRVQQRARGGLQTWGGHAGRQGLAAQHWLGPRVSAACRGCRCGADSSEGCHSARTRAHACCRSARV